MPDCPKCHRCLTKLNRCVWSYEWAPGEYPKDVSIGSQKFHTSYLCPNCFHQFPFTTQEEADAFLGKV